MFIVVLLFAAVVAGVLSLPSDWVRRRFPDPVRGVGELAGVIVLVGIGACFARLGLVDGLPSVLSLIAGLVVGAIVADRLATRLWGKPTVRS